MALKRKFASPVIAALALAAALSGAAAQDPAQRGTGASGGGDGSGMGQDNRELGTPKGPGDKPASAGAATDAPKPAGKNTQDAAPGAPAGTPGLIRQCDDGGAPVNGACRQ